MVTFPGPKHFCFCGLLLPLKKQTNKQNNSNKNKRKLNNVLQPHWYKDKYNPNQIIFSFWFKRLLKKYIFKLYFPLAFYKDYPSFLLPFLFLTMLFYFMAMLCDCVNVNILKLPITKWVLLHETKAYNTHLGRGVILSDFYTLF